jgi:hypothetical protein
MNVTTYPTATDFLNTALPFLETQETLNGVIIGISQRLSVRGEPTPNLYATVSDAQGMRAAAMMTPPRVVLLTSAEPGEDLRALASVLSRSVWNIPGVSGRDAIAAAFARAWTGLTGQAHHLHMNMRLYGLDRVIAPLPVSGQARLAAKSDVGLLVDWFPRMAREALGEVMSAEESIETVTARLEHEEVMVWEDGGQVVTMAARGRKTRHTQSIGMVYTPPELRRKGYASACVAALSQMILDTGFTHAVLFTDLANPTSNSIYQKIGYRPVGDFAEYRFG